MKPDVLGEMSECSAAWLAYLVRNEGVAGSNPATPTNSSILPYNGDTKPIHPAIRSESSGPAWNLGKFHYHAQANRKIPAIIRREATGAKHRAQLSTRALTAFCLQMRLE